MCFDHVAQSFIISECVKSVSSVASGVPSELCAHDVLHKRTHARLHV